MSDFYTLKGPRPPAGQEEHSSATDDRRAREGKAIHEARKKEAAEALDAIVAQTGPLHRAMLEMIARWSQWKRTLSMEETLAHRDLRQWECFVWERGVQRLTPKGEELLVALCKRDKR